MYGVSFFGRRTVIDPLVPADLGSDVQLSEQRPFTYEMWVRPYFVYGLIALTRTS